MENITLKLKRQSYNCKTCSKKFKKKHNLNVHERIHSKEKPFKCRKCNTSFRQRAHLNRHERTHEKKGDMESFSCVTCDQTFCNFGDQEFHAKTYPDHTMTPNKGNGIDRKVKNTQDKDNSYHENEIITQDNGTNDQIGNREKEVDQIQYQSPQIQCEDLDTNIQDKEPDTASKSMNSIENLQSNVQTNEKSFQCEICKKCFSRSAYLKVHERIHPGEKPYQCKLCLKRFRYLTSFKSHDRIHTEEKPFQCNICNKSFHVSWSLKVHKKIHSVETQVQCPSCQKSFAH